MKYEHGQRRQLTEEQAYKIAESSFQNKTPSIEFELIGWALLGSFAFNTDTPESDYDFAILINSDSRGSNFTGRFESEDGTTEAKIIPIQNQSAIGIDMRIGLMAGEFTFTDNPWSAMAQGMRFNEYAAYDNFSSCAFRNMRLADKAKTPERQFKFLRRTLKESANAEHISKHLLNGTMSQYRMALSESERERLLDSIEEMRSILYNDSYQSARSYAQSFMR